MFYNNNNSVKNVNLKSKTEREKQNHIYQLELDTSRCIDQESQCHLIACQVTHVYFKNAWAKSL